MYFFVGLLLLISKQLTADELLIVVAKDSQVKTISTHQLENIFRRKARINEQGGRWIPINLGIENPVRVAFAKSLFRKRPEEMESFWNIQYFTTKGL